MKKLNAKLKAPLRRDKKENSLPSSNTADRNCAPPGLLKSAAQRKYEFIKALRKAMSAMEHDIEENEGIYPFNGGALSAREVCRRASVSHQTLQGKLHKDTTRDEVNSWIKRIKAKAVQGKKKVRKAVTERVDTWKERHDNIAQHYHKNKLEMIDMRAEMAKLKSDNEALRALLERGTSGNVVSLPGKKGKGVNSGRPNKDS